MSVQILSPQAGAVFSPSQTIPVSGINGPISKTEVDPTSSVGDAAAEQANETGSPFSTTVGPITSQGQHTIRVTGPGGRTASVTVTISAG